VDLSGLHTARLGWRDFGAAVAWGRINDDMAFHPKIVAAGNAAVGARDRMIAWSNEHQTGGCIPAEIARLICGKGPTLKRCIDHRLLDRKEDGTLWVHNFDAYNLRPEEVQEKQTDLQKKRSDAGKKGAEKRWQTPDLPMANDGKTDGKTIANGMANGWQTDGPNPSPNPNPIDRDRDLDLDALQQAGFEHYGQLGGRAVATAMRLSPIKVWELDAAIATKGRSWPYALKVIESAREEREKPTPPAGEKPLTKDEQQQKAKFEAFMAADLSGDQHG
jgi:hypothetical protein